MTFFFTSSSFPFHGRPSMIFLASSSEKPAALRSAADALLRSTFDPCFFSAAFAGAAAVAALAGAGVVAGAVVVAGEAVLTALFASALDGTGVAVAPLVSGMVAVLFVSGFGSVLAGAAVP